MKKSLLIAAVTAALSTSAMAEDNMFYLRGDVGANMMTQEKVSGAKFKGKTSTGLDLGVGYYVMDNLRGELVWSHMFSPEATNTTAGVKSKFKATIDALILKGVVDVADLGVAKAFVDAGVGLAQVKEKATQTAAGVAATSKSFKQKTNFCFTVGTGVGFELADGVKADVQYAYTDFGKAKSNTTNGVTTSSLRRKSNAIKAGVRFEI